MQEITKHQAGVFSYVDLSTTDTKAAKKFYCSLFDWTSEDMPIGEGMTYSMLRRDGKDVAGLSSMPPGMDGAPPCWTSYITVEDADEAVESARRLGGSVVKPPFDVFDAGRMAVLQDPTGGVFAIWQAKKSIGAYLLNAPGSLAWNELATRDTAKATTFYENLFGWKTEASPMGESGEIYHVFMRGEQPVGGMMSMDKMPASVPVHWAVYFAVADCDESLNKAVKSGATMVVPATDVPGTGRFSTLRDPQGGYFAIIALDAMS